MAIEAIGGETLQGVYGSAQWGRDALDYLPDMLKHENGSSWIPLGRSLEAPDRGCIWNPRREEGHALTFAPTRSGKGVSVIIPALLTYAGSSVVLDVKGENAWLTAPRRRAFGHKVKIVDPWDEVNRRYAGGERVETISKFNPLETLDPSSRGFADDVAALAAALIIPSGNDPHWGDSARELTGACTAAVVEERPGRATLHDVRRLLLLNKEDFAKAVAAYQKLNPGSLGSRKLTAFADGSKETDSVFSTARTQTAFLDSDYIRESVESDSEPFDLAELGCGRMTVYLVLPAERMETHGRWLRLILTLALNACARQALPAALPVLFLLDEFGTIGRLPMIESAFGLNAGTGAGVRLWCFLQDLTQLSGDYPQKWRTFISNSSIIQLLAARDDHTAEYFSKLIGEMSTYRTRTTIISDNAEHHAVGAYRYEMRDIPERDVQRPLIYPAELTRLPKNQQIILYAGYQPIKTGRFVYYDTYEWAEEYRPIPGKPVKTRADFPPPVITLSKADRERQAFVRRLQKSDNTLSLLKRYRVIFFPVLILYYPVYTVVSIVRFIHHHVSMVYYGIGISRGVGINYSEVDEYLNRHSAT